MYQRNLRIAIANFATDRTRVVILICLVAISLRVAVAFWLPREVIWEDGHRYEHVANNLTSGHGFGSLPENALSVPTQPLLIALVKALFGESYLALRIFFSLIGAGTCIAGYFLATRLFGNVVGLFSGLALALYPYYVYLSALFEYPQTFYILVNTLAFLTLYNFYVSKSRALLFVSGLLFGLSILSVPTALLFMPFVALSLYGDTLRVWMRNALLVAVAASIPVGAWAIRNYSAYGVPVLINKASGVNFWIANNESYYQYGKKAVVPFCGPENSELEFCRDYKSMRANLSAAHLNDTDSVLASEVQSWQLGIKFMRLHPDHFLALIPIKFLRFWSPDPDAVSQGAAHGGTHRALIARLSYLPILIAGAFGMAIAAWKKRRDLLLIGGYFLAMTAPYCVFLPTARYRLPLDIFLIMFASFAIASVARLGAPSPARAGT